MPVLIIDYPDEATERTKQLFGYFKPKRFCFPPDEK
jgi:hypothetical protein